MTDEKIAEIPVCFRDLPLEQPDAIAWVDHLVEAAKKSVEGKNLPTRWGGPARSLMILGPTGVGKTHIAYATYQHMLNLRLAGRLLFVNAADLYAQLRPSRANNSEELMRRYQQASVLFLDDLGSAKPTEWNEEINYRLINYRYENGLPMMITANITPAQLDERLSERLASRLRGMSQTLVIRGGDRRKLA